MKKTVALVLVLILALTLGSSAFAGTATWFPLRLFANPTTGYDWQFQMVDEGIIELKAGEYTVNDSDVIGSPGYYDYMILGQKEGTTSLICSYQQFSDEATTVVTVIYTFNVDENLNVYLMDAAIDPIN